MAPREQEETKFKVPKTLPPLCKTNCRSPEKPTKSLASFRPFDREKPAKALHDREPKLASAELPVQHVNRCSSCRKKAGLTGFRCHCGDLFCSDHRYTNCHVCSYDYKAVDREAITKENAVCRERER